MISRISLLLLFLGLTASLLSTSCKPKIDETFATQTEKLLLKVDTLHTGLENPWGMTWLPDGTLNFFTRKFVFLED